MSVLPPRPRTSDMTFWSRFDPIRMPRGNTDNWAKLRVRSNTYSTNMGLTGLDFTPVADPATSQFVQGVRFQYSADGVRRLPEPNFSDAVVSGLRGQLPGDLGRSQSSGGLRKTWMNNEYHNRAKNGFRYWLIERPRPTNFGKYGMGSFKTVLGVGNGPRT